MGKQRINEGFSCIERKTRVFEDPITKFRRHKQNIRFIIQRAKYGYCDSDVWEIDTWFINTVPSMLRHLRDTTKSFPPELGNSDLSKLCLSDEESEEGYARWMDILTEMIDLFNKAEKGKAHNEDEFKKCEESKNRAFELFSRWFYDLFD